MAKLMIFFSLVAIGSVLFLFYLTLRVRTNNPIPQPKKVYRTCPIWVSNKTITPLDWTKHLLVSAYLDKRVSGFDLRLIGIFKRDSIQTLYCLFCCQDQAPTTTLSTVLQHSDNFGFPYVTTDVMCAIPQSCKTTYVSLQTEPHSWSRSVPAALPIRNLKMAAEQFDFTVCISTLFGHYNNVLQFAQSLEMYRLLGVNRVVVYNTSSGPELESLLRVYSQEGFVEIVPWPIDEHLTPSYGWLFSQSGGDLHYFGQQTTLNDCIYRSMDRSRYVLLNDIDEIIMPYQHSGLLPLMDTLRQQHPNAAVFLIENNIFPKKHFEPSGRFKLTRWSGVPGVNILEHIYREEPDRDVYNPHKLIIQPRLVEQTSVHEALKVFGEQVKVSPDLSRVIHTRVSLRKELTLEQLTVDRRLWDFSEQLIAGVDEALRRAKLLGLADKVEGPASHTAAGVGGGIQ